MKELLNKPSSWCQGPFAKDAEGNSVSVYSEKAVCFCLQGALDVCYSESNRPEIGAKLNAECKKFERDVDIQEIFQELYYIGFNEHEDTTFEDIRLVLERADV